MVLFFGRKRHSKKKGNVPSMPLCSIFISSFLKTIVFNITKMFPYIEKIYENSIQYPGFMLSITFCSSVFFGSKKRFPGSKMYFVLCVNILILWDKEVSFQSLTKVFLVSQKSSEIRFSQFKSIVYVVTTILHRLLLVKKY